MNTRGARMLQWFTCSRKLQHTPTRMYACNHFGIYPRRSLSGMEYIYVSGDAMDVYPGFLSARLYARVCACVRVPGTRACVRVFLHVLVCWSAHVRACVRVWVYLCARARGSVCVCSVSVVVRLYLCLGRVCAHVHMFLHFRTRACEVKACSVCVPRGSTGWPSRATGGICDGRVCVLRLCHRSVARGPQE